MYTLAPAPQQLFINPDTQALASNGFVWFYKDTDRITIKPVYRNTGTPGNPVYTQAPLNRDNSLSLNASGAFPYFIYYYPFDADGNYDLYFVQAKTSDGIQILAEGNYPTLNDIEVVSQLIYFIGTACSGTPNLADKTQVAEAVSQYVHVANYYRDSSTVANVYVAHRDTPDTGEDEELPCDLQDGMCVRFTPAVTNTGASTFTFTTKQGTTTYPIKMPITGADLPSGILQGRQTTQSIGYELTWALGLNAWYLTNDEAGNSVEQYKVKVNAADTSPDFLINKLEAGSGISLAASGDNSHVIISNNHKTYGETLIGTQVTSTVISGVTGGDVLISGTVTPTVSGSTFFIQADISGILTALGSSTVLVWIESGGVCLGWAMATTAADPNILIVSPSIFGAVLNNDLSDKNITLRWGVANSGESAVINDTQVTAWGFAKADVTLIVNEVINPGF